MDKQTLVTALAAGSVAFGAAAIAVPDTLMTTYRFTPNPEARSMTRLWGTRNVALGVLAMRAKGQALDDVLGVAVLLNAVDAVLGVAGNALDGTTGPGSALGGATSGIFGVLFAYARTL